MRTLRLCGSLIIYYVPAVFFLLIFPSCVGPPGVTTVGLYGINTAMDKRPVGVKVKDDTLNMGITMTLSDYPRVKSFVYEKTAYLAGYVKSREEKEEILEKVSKKNLKEIKVHFMLLSAASTSGMDDFQTKLAIKKILIDDPDLSVININVITVGGMVVLIGKVEEELHRRKAEYLMKKIGLKLVHNYLTVQPRMKTNSN